MVPGEKIPGWWKGVFAEIFAKSEVQNVVF
jgi:hypothetical protein